MPRLETPAVLRAIAIVLMVATHADLFVVTGGAHLLLAVAGYNLARFQLADVPGRRASAGLLRSAAQVVDPGRGVDRRGRPDHRRLQRRRPRCS